MISLFILNLFVLDEIYMDLILVFQHTSIIKCRNNLEVKTQVYVSFVDETDRKYLYFFIYKNNTLIQIKLQGSERSVFWLPQFPNNFL